MRSRRFAIIQSQGLLCTLDYLGESVTSLAAADTATREYLQLIDAVDRADVERNLSLKLTQIGLDVDRAICIDNLRKILTAAEPCGFFVRIDMESSAYTDATLDIFETAWKSGHRNVGVVLQSCLYRTEKDFERVNALGARIRLVKGAYREPKSVAYQLKSDVDAAYVRLAKRLLTEGVYPAIATHDEDILERGKALCLGSRDLAGRLRVPDALRHSTRSSERAFAMPATACACMCPSAANGFPTSCAVSANGRPTSPSWFAVSSQNGDLDAEPQSRKEFFRKQSLRLCASASKQAIRIVYLPSDRRCSGSARRASADTRSTGRDDAPRDSE